MALVEEEQFQLSPTTNSALKVLNQPKFAEIFKKDYAYFEENQLIPYFRLFFQLTGLFQCDTKDITNHEFVFKIKEYFSYNSVGLGIGDLSKNLSDKFDFSEDNVERVFQIMQNNQLKSIDTVKVGKLCKTTGIISFLVKDALVYCGLDVNDKKSGNVKNFSEKKFIIEHNFDFKDMLNVSNKVLEKLDDVITKFQF